MNTDMMAGEKHSEKNAIYLNFFVFEVPLCSLYFFTDSTYFIEL